MSIYDCASNALGDAVYYVGIELERDISWWPDTSYGTKDVTRCTNAPGLGYYGSGWATWGEMASSGKYYFVFHLGADSVRLYANPVIASY